VVDYHSLTQKYIGIEVPEGVRMDQDVKELRESVNKTGIPEDQTLKTAATLLACGIDPLKSSLFVQSHVSAHTEMQWILSNLTPLSWLNKMIQFKEKKA